MCRPGVHHCQELHSRPVGFVLSAEGLGSEQGKVQVMKAVQVPSNVKGVQRFLGLVGYYRRFIRAFAEAQ